MFLYYTQNGVPLVLHSTARQCAENSTIMMSNATGIVVRACTQLILSVLRRIQVSDGTVVIS